MKTFCVFTKNKSASVYNSAVSTVFFLWAPRHISEIFWRSKHKVSFINEQINLKGMNKISKEIFFVVCMISNKKEINHLQRMNMIVSGRMSPTEHWLAILKQRNKTVSRKTRHKSCKFLLTESIKSFLFLRCIALLCYFKSITKIEFLYFFHWLFKSRVALWAELSAWRVYCGWVSENYSYRHLSAWYNIQTVHMLISLTLFNQTTQCCKTNSYYRKYYSCKMGTYKEDEIMANFLKFKF